jgi:hypothetical protein
MVSSPLGTAAGGPLVGALGAAQTLTASGAATVLLAVTMGFAWRPGRRPRRLAAEQVRRDITSDEMGAPLAARAGAS